MSKFRLRYVPISTVKYTSNVLIEDENSERVMKAQEVKKRLMEQTFVPIQSVDDHIEKLNRPAVSSSNFLQHIEAMRTVNPKDLQDWATVGVLAANPEERTSSTSAKYSLLKITDLVDVQLNVLLFGRTHEAWAKRLKLGMVIGIQHPKILRPTEVIDEANS